MMMVLMTLTQAGLYEKPSWLSPGSLQLLDAMLQTQGFTVQRQVPLTCGICTATIATA